MGHAHSRHDQHGHHPAQHPSDHSDQSSALHTSASASSPSSSGSFPPMHTSPMDSTPIPSSGSRKRRRSASSSDIQNRALSTHDSILNASSTSTHNQLSDQSSRQRRRTEPSNDAEVLHPSSLAAHSSSPPQSLANASTNMELDPQDPSSSLPHTDQIVSTSLHANDQTSTAAASSDASSDASSHQATLPDPTPASQDFGGTPPPELDVLRQERERARRQILETLLQSRNAPSPAAPTSLPQSSTLLHPPAEVQSSTPSISTSPSSQTHPITSSTLAALLGGALNARTTASPSATAVAGENPPSQPISASGTSIPSSSADTSTATNATPQQLLNEARRTTLHPGTISGTSMIVQGALVARTIPNRRATSEAPSSRQHFTEQNNAPSISNNPTATSSSSASMDASNQASGGPSSDQRRTFHNAASDAFMSDTEGPRAVTLEEQAVMLSRILGIAAAATAASLVNTSGTHQVDRALLQSSLQPPFLPPDQQSDQNRGLARPFDRHPASQPPYDPRSPSIPSLSSSRSSTARHRRTASSSHSTPSSGAASASSGLGHGLRQRLSALSQRVRSASENLGLGSSTSPVVQPPASGSRASSNQHEIIARLLDAANREAEAELRRRRTANETPATPSVAESSPSGQPPGSRSARFDFDWNRTSSTDTNAADPPATNQGSNRSSLSRFLRETFGQLLTHHRHARRDSASNNDTSSDTSESSPHQAVNGSGTTAPTPAGFSLGPNDVEGTLRQVRNGVLPDGVPGSFGNFLNQLLRDLMVAVQSMHAQFEPLPTAEVQTSDYFEQADGNNTSNGAEVLDAEAGPDTNTFQAQAALLRDEVNRGLSTTNDRPEADPTDSLADAEVRERREPDIQNGNLSFFRLFRFDPVPPSVLVPCIVVGVRSLDATERLGVEMTGAGAASTGGSADTGGMGAFGARQQTSQPTRLGADPEAATANTGVGSTDNEAGHNGSHRADTSSSEGNTENEPQAGELPASRFLLFVSGGRYPANHPLLTSHPSSAGRDLMILMDLLGTMQAMQNKPSTATQQEIDSSELVKIRGGQVAQMVIEGKVTENMAERCLVCLEDWQAEDECRLLACRHVFHTGCVDKWMTNSSNTCPMCRRQGVAKDGRRAGEETADSRNAPQL